MKKSKFSLLICCIMVVVILGLFGACSKAETTANPTSGLAPEVNKLRIGILVAMTGWFAPFDMLNWQENEIVADMINEEGGITVNGKKYELELIPEDYKSSLDGVTAATTKLVYDKKVQFIVGPAAFFSSATAAICDPNKVIHVLGACMYTPGECDATTPYAFLAKNATLGHAQAVLGYFKEKHPEVKSVVMVTAAPAILDFWFPKVQKMAKDYGITIVGDPIAFPDDMVDYSPIAAKIAATKADAIYMQLGIASHMGAVLKGVRELGDNRLFGAAIASSPSEIVSLAGEAAARNAFTLAPTQGALGNTPQCEEFIKRLKERFGPDRAIVMEVCNALLIFKQVIEKAQSFDTTVVKDTWEKIGTVETLWGTGKIGGLETNGIAHAISHRQSIALLDENGEMKFDGWMDVDIP